ncbi:MAG: hypothetical protein NC489_15935 [Ruminococcus flavefaciens]|nr:hypothetical protein [Ruminococcus flavefaciens]
MWNWIMNELYNACKTVGVSKSSGAETDDVVQDVCIQLLEKKEYAKEIYDGRKTWLLAKLVKAQIYESKSKLFFENKMELSRYQRIISVCDRYGIEPDPANAYKISAVMNERTYSIAMIASLLETKKRRTIALQDYIDTEGSEIIEIFV